jgi:uncharacterized phage protein (TIGR01671 family)
MKRQIKFRGKRIGDGDWVFGYLTHLTGMHKTCIKSDGYYISDEQGRQPIHLVEESTVGQFTGLLDKNGKEIYEGDIVLYETDFFSKEERIIIGDYQLLSLKQKYDLFPHRFNVCAIYWDVDESRFALNHVQDKRILVTSMGLGELEKCEIIGNAHNGEYRDER